ncbi:MAG: hypothetical protein ACKPE1_19595 [Dolichospermum sp.]
MGVISDPRLLLEVGDLEIYGQRSLELTTEYLILEILKSWKS